VTTPRSKQRLVTASMVQMAASMVQMTANMVRVTNLTPPGV
jgi:hypothetical protein